MMTYVFQSWATCSSKISHFQNQHPLTHIMQLVQSVQEQRPYRI